MPKPDSLSFRHLMGCFPTGIVIATTEDRTLGKVGITINSLTSVSLKPPLILFCLEKKAHMHPIFKRNDYFALNFLGAGQKNVSQHFANHRLYGEPQMLWEKSQHGCPIIALTLGWAVCKKTKIVSAGDHSIFLGEIVSLKQAKGELDPLVYFRGQYNQLKG